MVKLCRPSTSRPTSASTRMPIFLLNPLKSAATTGNPSTRIGPIVMLERDMSIVSMSYMTAWIGCACAPESPSCAAIPESIIVGATPVSITKLRPVSSPKVPSTTMKCPCFSLKGTSRSVRSLAYAGISIAVSATRRTSRRRNRMHPLPGSKTNWAVRKGMDFRWILRRLRFSPARVVRW